MTAKRMTNDAAGKMTKKEMLASILFTHNYQAQTHVVVNQGGSSSGKTYAILQVLFTLAVSSKVVITVVGQDIPNLKVGALRDAQDIYRTVPAFRRRVRKFKHGDRVFEFKNGSIIEFNSYHDAQDAKSGKRDYLFINEANGIKWPVYMELALRTRKRVFTASIVASVVTTYFGLKADIYDVRVRQEAQNRIDEIRLKVLEGQVAVLQTEVAQLKKRN